MKMQPIVYTESYSDVEVCGGFTPYRSEKGKWISSRKVDISFAPWEGGSCMEVKLFDVFVDGSFERVTNLVVYDTPRFYEQYIVPSRLQKRFIHALASNDLRGLYAENIVRDLYIDMVVLNPKSKWDQWLPELVSFWKDHYQKHNFSIESK